MSEVIILDPRDIEDAIAAAGDLPPGVTHLYFARRAVLVVTREADQKWTVTLLNNQGGADAEIS